MARFIARLTILVGVLLVFAAGNTPASAGYGKRFALVIGNSNYESVQKLPNAANDAKDIAKALEALRFKVFSGVDLDAQGFSQLIEDFRKEAAEAETVVFYYAGHGFQLDSSNYLVPINAQLKSRDAIDKETLALNEIIARIHN
jgi:uncharacterized caspase-like protein